MPSDVIFRHAGVYTAEEIALVFRDKLIRLQSLYIDQFKRLHHRLREKRRQYLHTMRRSFPTSGIASSVHLCHYSDTLCLDKKVDPKISCHNSAETSQFF